MNVPRQERIRGKKEKELTVSEAQEEEEGPHDPKASAEMAKPAPEAQVVILANVRECVCVRGASYAPQRHISVSVSDLVYLKGGC